VSSVQLQHSGRRAKRELTGQQPLCPWDDAETGARALTTAEVGQLVQDFIEAALRAEAAGFDGAELHGAHGYLICQFLSPELNQRADEFGGTLENRSRLLFNIIDGIRAECGDDFALAVRLSPERFGIRTAEIVELYQRLVASGQVDLIDMSLWDVDRRLDTVGFEGRSLTEIFAELPRDGVRLGVAGKIHDPADVQRVLDAGADIAVLGRVAILHHDYPQLLKRENGFVPRRPPVRPEVLAAEGVSPKFFTYLSGSFKGFVDQS